MLLRLNFFIVSLRAPKLREYYLVILKNYSHNKHCGSKIWLYNLPFTVQYLILSRLKHLDLINLAVAFPVFFKVVMQPIYWSQLNLVLYSDILNINEVYQLVSHINLHLKYLNIELHKFSTRRSDSITRIFKKCINIKDLRLSLECFSNEIIDSICCNLKCLRYLELICKSLNNEHIITVTKNLTHLISLHVESLLDIEEGLIYFLESTHHLVGFGVIVNNATEK